MTVRERKTFEHPRLSEVHLMLHAQCCDESLYLLMQNLSFRPYSFIKPELTGRISITCGCKNPQQMYAIHAKVTTIIGLALGHADLYLEAL